MITCQKCGKENQDHYKFCLGCGAELSAGVAASAAVSGSAAAPPAGNKPEGNSGAGDVAFAGNASGGSSSSGGPLAGGPLAGGLSAGGASTSIASVIVDQGLSAQAGTQSAPEQRAVDATHASPGVQPPKGPTDAEDENGSSVSVVSIASKKSDLSSQDDPGSSPAGAAVSPIAPPVASGDVSAASQEAPGEAGTPAPPPADADLTCPQCSRINAIGNRFCASCGYKLNMTSLPARPAGAAAVTNVGEGEISLTALRADGTEAGSFTLPTGPSQTVGRDTGSIFSGDSYLSPRHATFVRKGDRLLVSDAGSLNGVYYKISPNTPWTLRFGDVFRIGQEILRLEKLEGPSPSPDGVRRLGSPADGYVARLGLVIGRDTTGNAFPVPKAGLHLGRERGDVLFPEDGYVSGLHCRLAVAPDGTITLTDLGSSNGSFVRLKDEHPVSGGDILLMGQQLFRINA